MSKVVKTVIASSAVDAAHLRGSTETRRFVVGEQVDFQSASIISQQLQQHGQGSTALVQGAKVCSKQDVKNQENEPAMMSRTRVKILPMEKEVQDWFQTQSAFEVKFNLDKFLLENESHGNGLSVEKLEKLKLSICEKFKMKLDKEVEFDNSIEWEAAEAAMGLEPDKGQELVNKEGQPDKEGQRRIRAPSRIPKDFQTRRKQYNYLFMIALIENEKVGKAMELLHQQTWLLPVWKAKIEAAAKAMQASKAKEEEKK